MTPTAHQCWKCGAFLNELAPPIDGWKFHCPTCQHLTSPREQLHASMANLADGAAGVVAAVPCTVTVVDRTEGGTK